MGLPYRHDAWGRGDPGSPSHIVAPPHRPVARGPSIARRNSAIEASTISNGAVRPPVAIYLADNGGTAKITTSYAMRRPYCLSFSVYRSGGRFERTRQQGESGCETANYLDHSRLSGTGHMIPVTLPNFSNPDLARQVGHAGLGTMEYEQARDVLAAIVNDTEPKLGPRGAAASIVPLICGLDVAEAGGGMMEIPSQG